MSARGFEILQGSAHKENDTHVDQQLHRMMTLASVKRSLEFSHLDYEEPQQHTEPATINQAHHDQRETFDFNTVETKTENISVPDDLSSMLKGMKGYQLTTNDLLFIKKMKEDAHIKKLQSDLEDTQKLLKTETAVLELMSAFRDTASVELNKFASCEELTEWVKVVLKMTRTVTEITDVDTKALLAMVTTEDVQRVIEVKRIELSRTQKMVANKKKKEAKEKRQLEKQIASQQLEVQDLMKQLTSLTAELEHEEEAYKALQMQIKTQEEAVEAEEVKASEELQATKSPVECQGKKRRKVVRYADMLQGTSARGKHTGSKADNHITVKDDLKTKQNSVAEELKKSDKAARGRVKKVVQGSDSQDSVRGRRKPPKTGEAASTSQQMAPSPSRRKAGVAADVEEAQIPVLRRSKRIANRK
uniref:structural maintenance of chromosomes protein 1-like isoform X1 n=1 Tax=Monopterus albus TaxID=43700 RepID=UPI0009B2FF08|nr:structural maintenance of chromosomes protein 1-like isoform X1 [Monopterus albus]